VKAARGASDRVPWRALAWSVLIPNLFQAMCQGVAVPAIPLRAHELTNSVAVAAIAAAMLSLGQLLTTLPAGWLVARFGERFAMTSSTGATILGVLLAYFAPGIGVFLVGVALIGAGGSVFQLARQSWITITVPAGVRGRTLSAVAGLNRLGSLVGPLIAAAVFQVAGNTKTAFLVSAGLSVTLLIIVLAVKVPDDDRAADRAERGPGVLTTIVANRRLLSTLGATVSIISSMRSTRRIIVPLVGVAIGLDAVTIALLVSLGAAIDVILAYTGGYITDRLGRLWVALPTMIAFAISYFLVAVVFVVPSAGIALLVTSVIIGSMANGISGGLLATMGSDLADPRQPAPFLSSWRLISDMGSNLAPWVIAGLTAVASIGVATTSLGALSVLGAVLLPRFMHRYLPSRQVKANETG
jgi:MFS family permease